MNDVIRPTQSLDRFWTEQPVRIGDDADQDKRFSVLSSQFSVLSTRCSFLHLFDKLSKAHHRPPHGAAADFLHIVARRHTQNIEASIP